MKNEIPGRPGAPLKSRAVFLDRDGVINEVVVREGRPGSPRRLSELVLRESAGPSVARLRAGGYLVFVVTNQPDLARGLLSHDEHEAMLARVRQTVGVDAIAVCPHDDADGCDCRKPRAGLLRELAEDWRVDLVRSYMVGDTARDVGAGRSAGCRTILLRTDYNGEVDADDVVHTLEEAVELIESDADGKGFAERYLAEAREIASRLDVDAIEAMARSLAELRRRGGRLFFLGVGGGAAHASHAVNDFRKLAEIESYAPTDNVGELTARINDNGWEGSYAAYLRGSRLSAEDGVFVFSVGGGDLERNVSANLVRALQYAATVGASIFGVVGRDGGHTARVAEHCVVVPTAEAGRVTPHTESFQAVVWHLLVSHPALRKRSATWEGMNEG